MNNRNWNKPVLARIDDGQTQAIHNVKQAENFLLQRWHLLSPEALTAAIMACLLYAGDDGSLAAARTAFISALNVSGILG